MKYLLVLLMLIASPAWAGWTLVAESAKEEQFYVDLQTIRKDGSRVKFWQLENKPKPVSLDKIKYLSVRSRQEYDCKQEQKRSLSITALDELNAKGNVVHTENEIGNWIEIPPETVMWAVMKSVCVK